MRENATQTVADPPEPTGMAAVLGGRAASLQWRDLPPQALHWARVGLLDTLGVTLAGSREEAPRIVANVLDLALGPSLMLGTSRRVGALDAALFNGTASHALDFDDCSNTMGGHPSAPVLSALLPLAEELGAHGRDFVLAYVVGFEVETKIAMAVNFHHYEKGWHPTATLGVFGAAAACGRLMGLDGKQMATALALAATFSSGLKANFGTMSKPLHVGHSARNGLLAARLARAGFTANVRDVFEHEQGFMNVFNGPGTYDVARAIDSWASPLNIIEPGIAIKQYPCCGSIHPAVDAMLDLVRTQQFKAQDVRHVQAWIHPRRLKHTNRPQPRTSMEAKFSLQYVLARALVDGHVGVADFESNAHEDSRVQALLPRIAVGGYSETMFPKENHFGGAVQVTLDDGRVLRASVDQSLGRTSANPLPQALLEAKFALCAGTVLRPEEVAAVAEQIKRIEHLPDLRELGRQLACTPSH